MAEETNTKETRKSRFFLYQDGTHVVIGKQHVRYEPNLAKDMFGTVAVEVLFPQKRSIKHGFQLSLYPEPRDQKDDDPSKNIIPTEDGIALLLQEVNRSAALQARSICKIDKKDFSYKNLTIIDDESIEPTDTGFETGGCYLFRGVIMKDFKFLRKGDVVNVGDCDEVLIDDDSTKTKLVWRCRWNPSKTTFKWYEKIRKLWIKMTNEKLYKERYVYPAELPLTPDIITMTSGKPVEPGTDRG